MLRLSPAADARHCQLSSATGKPGRICKKPVPGICCAKWWPRGCSAPGPPQPPMPSIASFSFSGAVSPTQCHELSLARVHSMCVAVSAMPRPSGLGGGALVTEHDACMCNGLVTVVPVAPQNSSRACCSSAKAAPTPSACLAARNDRKEQ
jgi:hypothetical protein